MPLAEHHAAWLAGHPERDEEWLARMLAEGFDVHHLDSDHANNDPQNLVLIDHFDHFRLHGRKGMALRFQEARAEREAAALASSEEALRVVAPVAYAHRRERGGWKGWSAKGTGAPLHVAQALAKEYAKRHELDWPLSAFGPVAGEY